MIGLGTLINVACVLAGGLVGMVGGRFITERMQDAIMKSLAVCIMFVGISGALEQMLAIEGTHLATKGTAMMVISMSLGAVLGEVLDLDGKTVQLGEWLKRRSGSEGDNSFVNAFVTCSLTVSVGAMAIVGSIQDGGSGDWSTLALNGAIDALLVCAMTASMGRGCIFSALPILVLEGGVTLLASALQPIFTEAALANLSLVGSLLIFCIGVNLIWPSTFKPANMLPAVIIAALCAFF